LTQRGLRVAFEHDWQVEVMEAAWKQKQITSAEAFEISGNLGALVSRTSVIYFLNRMVDENLLVSEPVNREGHLQFLYTVRPIIEGTDGVKHASPEAFKAWLFIELSKALAEVPESG
jgi:predicted transcriptional regulator